MNGRTMADPQIHSSPHVFGSNSTPRLMRQVSLALIPGALAAIWLFGWGVALNLLVAAATALLCEGLVLAARGRDPWPVLGDGSALLTGLLLALALPPLAPWWLTVIATAFAIVVAKQLYGGLGSNPFNPAMVGYVTAIVAFPREMTQWVAPGAGPGPATALAVQFAGAPPDAITAATPLDGVKTQLGLDHTLAELGGQPLFGLVGGAGWEWVNLAYLAGGLWLLYKGVIRWHIPVAMLAALALTALVFRIWDTDLYLPPLFHLFSGGAMLGAFFIATDPVSAATTVRGRLWYGAGIGVLVYLIRTWGGYPDGVAFAVLLMNMAAPTIDHYTRPRVFGARP